MKNLNLFNIIYRQTKSEDGKTHFEIVLNKFIKIAEEISQKESNELSLLAHFDSYERNIKSIFYFFDNFHNDENWNKILCPKYKDLLKENIKTVFKRYKRKKIYDYKLEGNSKSFYIKLFYIRNNKLLIF